MSRTILAALLAVALVAPLSAHASGPLDDPKPGTPAWYARSVSEYLYAQRRGIDMEANPGYQLRFAPVLEEWLPRQSDPDANARITTDPYRLDWGGTRGTSIPISYKNRYGARISGHLWIPKVPFTDRVTKAVSSGPFPAVVFDNGPPLCTSSGSTPAHGPRSVIPISCGWRHAPWGSQYVDRGFG